MSRPLVVVCSLRGRHFPAVDHAIRAQWPTVQTLEGSLDEPYGYSHDLCWLWGAGVSLVICEGDVIAPSGSIARLLACSEPWCAHPSWVGNRYLNDTLGLVKFSEALIRERPGLCREALSFRRRGEPWVPSRECDVRLSLKLRQYGLSPHVHQPPARHLRYANEPVD